MTSRNNNNNQVILLDDDDDDDVVPQRQQERSSSSRRQQFQRNPTNKNNFLIDDDDDGSTSSETGDDNNNDELENAVQVSEEFVKSKLKQLYNIPNTNKELFNIVEYGLRRQILLYSDLQIKFNTGVYFGTSHVTQQQQNNNNPDAAVEHKRKDKQKRNNNANSLFGIVSSSTNANEKNKNINNNKNHRNNKNNNNPDIFVQEEAMQERGPMIKQEKAYELQPRRDFSSTDSDSDDDESTTRNDSDNNTSSKNRKKKHNKNKSTKTVKNHVQLSLYNAVSDERQLFLDKIDRIYNNNNNSNNNNTNRSLIWYYAEADFVFDQNPIVIWRSLPNTSDFNDDRLHTLLGGSDKSTEELSLFRKATNQLLLDPARTIPILKYVFSLLYWRLESKLMFFQLNFLPSSSCQRISYSTLGFNHINQMIHITGTVVRISTSVSVCTQMTYACNNCGQVQVLPVHNGILNFPGTCITRGCNSTRFTPKVNGSNESARTLCDAVQYAKLQEDTNGKSSSTSTSASTSASSNHFQFFPDDGDNNNQGQSGQNGKNKRGNNNNNNIANRGNSSNNNTISVDDDAALEFMMMGSGMVGGAAIGGGDSSSTNNNNNNPSAISSNNQNNNASSSSSGGGGGSRSLIEISLKGRFRNQVSPGDNISVVGVLTSRKLEAGGRGTKAAQLLSCEVYGLKVIKASSQGMSLSSKLEQQQKQKQQQQNNNNNDANNHQYNNDEQNHPDAAAGTSTANSIQRNRFSSSSTNNNNKQHHAAVSTISILDGQDLLPILIKKFCPQIFGHVKTKAALLLSLVGGTAKPFPEAPRSQLHILMLGDAGIGKSQLLRAAWQSSRRGVFVTANSTSSCGLTITISKTTTAGGGDNTSCEAGAVLYGDGGVTCIDEIDKGHQSEQKALLEVMEQQTVSIAKAGVVFSMPIRTSVVAAGNPRAGRFDNDKSYAENVGLSPALVSRFDFVMLLQDHDGSVGGNDGDGNDNNSSSYDPFGSNNNNNNSGNPASALTAAPRLTELVGPLCDLYPEYQPILPILHEEIANLVQQYGGQHNFLSSMSPVQEQELYQSCWERARAEHFREVQKRQQQHQQQRQRRGNDSNNSSSGSFSSIITSATSSNINGNNSRGGTSSSNYYKKKREMMQQQQQKNSSNVTSTISGNVLRNHQASGKNTGFTSATSQQQHRRNNNNNNNIDDEFYGEDTSNDDFPPIVGMDHNNHLPPEQTVFPPPLNLLPGIDVRELIEHCQTHFHPYLNTEAQFVLFHAYLEARKKYFECGTVDSAEVTPRYLQSLIRATEARAKLAQMNVATKEHAEFAVALLNACRSLSAAANGGVEMSETLAKRKMETLQERGGGGGGGAKKLNEKSKIRIALENAAVLDPSSGKKKISVKNAENALDAVITGKKSAAQWLDTMNEGGMLLKSGSEYVLQKSLAEFG